MPSPSKLSLVLALAATGGIFYGGAWFASGLKSEAIAATPSQTERENYIPALIPGITASEAGGSLQAGRSVETLAKQAEKPGLTVIIDGVRNCTGSVLVLVFDDAAAYKAYNYERAVGFAELEASEGKLSRNFPNLTAGPYAVVVFHDENGNQDLDMESGYPLEGYGTSGADGPYDEPSFQKASTLPGEATVKMHYLF